MKFEFKYKIELMISGILFSTLAIAAPPVPNTDPAPPGTPVQSAEAITAAIRERLSPVVEAILQEHCGSDCPSFRVDPQFLKTNRTLLDDLGFTRPPQTNGSPDLKSISVSVLIGDEVSAPAKESLKLILANRVSNEITTPVVIQLKSSGLVSPIQEKQERQQKQELLDQQNRAKQAPPPGSPLTPPLSPALEWVRPLAWPVSTIILAALALMGFVLFFRYRMKLFRENAKLEVDRKAEQKSSTALESSVDSELVHTLVEKRCKDLQWLIEERSAKKDHESLRKITTLVPAEELSSRLKLSEVALRTIAWLPTDAQRKTPQTAELSEWILRALDRAHWRRMEEDRNPLMKLERLSEEQLLDSFITLPSLGEKAVLISSISKDRWPALLTTLNPNDRIQLGLMLAQYQNAIPADRRAMEAALIQRVSETLDGPPQFKEGIVEDFTLYLPEKEGQRLWQELSVRSKIPGQVNGHAFGASSLSVDTLLQNLEAGGLLEVCMSVDIRTLQALLPTLSSSTRERIYQVLPKGLRARLVVPASESKGVSENDASMMKAKADFIGAFRKVQARV